MIIIETFCVINYAIKLQLLMISGGAVMSIKQKVMQICHMEVYNIQTDRFIGHFLFQSSKEGIPILSHHR
jgi:hypothetical protein